MKTKIDRMKNRAKCLSVRSLAMVLCTVLLLTAIGTGVVFTAIAATVNADGQSKSDAIKATADAFDTEVAMLGEASSADVGKMADTEGTISKKGDADLAATGTGGTIYFDNNTNQSWDYNVTTTISTSGKTFINSNKDLNLYIKDTSGNQYGNNNNCSYGGSSILSKNGGSGDSDRRVYLVNAANYSSITVKITQNGDDLKIEWTGGTPKVTSYSISYNTPTNGSFTTKPTSANSDSTVTFVATPSNGYTVDTVTITNSSTSAAITPTVSGTTYTFTMPSADVSVSATFKKATYTITASATYCTVSGFTSPAEYGSTVSFTVTPDTDYALKTLTVKQGSTSVSVTDGGSNSYSFTMPAGNVTITAVCATTTGTAEIYFKSATAWVYHPFITVNDGAEQEMTVDTYLTNGAKSSAVKPKSDTGSLRYAWYKIDMTGIDTSKPVTIKVRGNDTYMEAEGTFTIGSGDSLYLACDNLMEGSTLVDVSSLSEEARDFYDTPLNMIDD